MPRRPCLDCGVLSQGSRCPTHTAARAQVRDTARGSSAARGYGPAHRARRALLLPLAYGTLCPRCGVVMLPGQGLDLDHVIPIAHGGRDDAKVMVHALCNRRAGGRTRRA
jgi:5-methylcytosine-specific restriction endonuclease McrA